jgi:hypothetical protein
VIDHQAFRGLTPIRRRTPVPARRSTPGGSVVALVGLLTVLNAWTWRWFVHPDSTIAQRAADVLFSAHWYRTFLDVPQAQMGPLSIAASRLPHDLYVVLVAGLSLPFLALAAAGLTGRRRDPLWYAACFGLIVPWSQFAWKGHADDALVLLCAALVVHALDRGAGAGVVLTLWAAALLAKPTAILFLPLVVTSIDTMMLAAIVFALLWLPFVWASPTGFLHAAKGIMQVSPHSLWGELGLADGPPPIWLRPVQLAVSLAMACWAAARRAPAVALLLAFTVRSMAEMNPAPSYAGSVIALALLADARSGRLPVLFSVPALAAFWTSQQALEGSSGWPRIVAHLTVIALCVWTLSRRPGDQPRTSGSFAASSPSPASWAFSAPVAARRPVPTSRASRSENDAGNGTPAIVSSSSRDRARPSAVGPSACVRCATRSRWCSVHSITYAER